MQVPNTDTTETFVNVRAEVTMEHAVVFADLLVDRASLEFSNYEPKDEQGRTPAPGPRQELTSDHTLRIPAFYDRKAGKGHLIALNAQPLIVESEASKGDRGHTTRPEPEYMVQQIGDRTVYGVWPFYVNLTSEEIEAINSTGDGRVKIEYSRADEDWLPTEWDAKQVRVLAMRKTATASAETQQAVNEA